MPPTAPPRLIRSLPAAFALAAAALLAAVAAPPPARAAEAPAEPSAEAPARAARRDADPAQRMWWNRERMVAGLGLSPEQRTAMDERLRARLEERRGYLERYGEARAAMAEALTGGDWEAAEAKRSEAGEAMAAANGAESALVIDVLKLLSETQRERIGEENPYLLRRPWLVGGLNRALRRGGGRPAAGGETP